MLAILEAQTAQFEARMSAAGQQIDHFTRTGTSARAGVHLLKSGMQSLALEGLGALPGPLARVATGLGVLTIGSPLMLGVLAASAAVGMALTKMGDDGQAAADNAVAGMERIRKNLDTFVQSHGNLDEGSQGIALLEARIARARELLALQQESQKQPGGLSAADVLSGKFGANGIVGAASQENIAATVNYINQLTVALANLNRTMDTLIATRNSEDARKFFTVQRWMHAPVNFPSFGPTSRAGKKDPFVFGPGSNSGIPGQDAATEAMRQRSTGLAESLITVPTRVAQAQQLLNVALEQGWITTQQRAEAEVVLQQQLERSQKGVKNFGVALAGAVASAVMALAHAHGPAGFTGAAASGAGSILATYALKNPSLAMPAAVLQGLGGIFSLFDNSQDKRQAEAERAAERRHREMLRVLKETEPVVVAVRSTDWTDPREMDLLARAITDARERRALSEAA